LQCDESKHNKQPHTEEQATTMSLPGRDDKEKLEALGNRTYKEQAVWYLNGYWKKGAEQQAERVWTYAHDASKLEDKGMAGGILDEFQGLPNQSLLDFDPLLINSLLPSHLSLSSPIFGTE